ncbi:MAG TPA: serine/threonine-protein kinase [Polyangiaceae bacterium]|nr:serine/threonine-protein kinase [Polyangiaceae bacterium]
MPSDTLAQRKIDTSQLPLGSVINDGKYRVISLIASGGMGHVYEAEQAPLGRRVALKVVRLPSGPDSADGERPEYFRKRFFREASILAKMQHPNVVTIHDYGRIEGQPERYFMAMEYLDGMTLAQCIDSRAPLPADETLRLLRQVARGLREAHRLGAVHRDLKPSNIMLVPDEEGAEVVKILDFGIGKLLGSPGEEQELTQEGSFLGSPKYVAPEMVNERRVDERTDVYSLGVIAYECLTGQLPFQTETNLEMILAHCSAPVPEMSHRAPRIHVPPVIEAFVRKCLEKAPEARPQSMEEVLRGIAECEQAVFGTTSSRGVPSGGSGSGAGSVRSEAPSKQPPASGNNDPSVDTLVSNPGLPNPVSTATPSVSPGPQPQSQSRSRFVVVAAVAVLLVLGVVVARRLAHPSSESPQAAAASASAPAASAVASAGAQRSFVLVLDSTPQGADVLEGDQLLGTTPVQVTIDRASVRSGPRRFVLRLDGYAQYTVLQGDSTTNVESVALLVASAPPTPSASATAPPRRAPRPPAARPTPKPDTDIKLSR